MTNEENSSSSLQNDKAVSSIQKLSSRVSKVKSTVDKYFEIDVQNKLTAEERVKFDLLLAYTTTSLFWSYLRTEGIDPHQHPLKKEIERVKSYMAKAKYVQERHLRPQVNQDASKRFVRNALWTPPQQESKPDSASKKRKRINEEAETSSSV